MYLQMADGDTKYPHLNRQGSHWRRQNSSLNLVHFLLKFPEPVAGRSVLKKTDILARPGRFTINVPILVLTPFRFIGGSGRPCNGFLDGRLRWGLPDRLQRIDR